MKILNVQVYDLYESVIACRNAMRTTLPVYTETEFRESLKRAKKLCQTPAGSGHANFRKGIRVSFDIVYPSYLTPQMQRYSFFDIVSSNSKMHKIMEMDFDICCNEWVTEESKALMKRLIAEYKADKSEKNFMRVISNCPFGIELFMRVSTNYEQLATIYRQRKDHKLPEWREYFCKEFIPSLPYAEEFIMCTKQ